MMFNIKLQEFVKAREKKIKGRKLPKEYMSSKP